MTIFAKGTHLEGEMKPPELTVGIEEEYFLVHLESRDLAEDPPEEFMLECTKKLDKRVSPEFMRSQIEVGTRPHASIISAIKELEEMRATIAAIAKKFDLAPIAASTHPFANYREQIPTHRQRYEDLASDLGTPVRRLQICGCHVHIGISDKDLLIDIMNQASYFLPHILALSTSSPFWSGEDTSLSSYRLSVFDALPRTGLPDYFDSFGEYERLIGQLVRVGSIEDASKIWWDIRPSSHYPTLEMRISDVCTNINDCAAIAATFQALIAMLYRLRQSNQRWRIYPRLTIEENRWRAMRYGINGKLIDLGAGKSVAVKYLVDELIELLREDAKKLGTIKQLNHLKTIIKRGTSSDKQREIFQTAIRNGASKQEALKQIIDFLIKETSKEHISK